MKAEAVTGVAAEYGLVKVEASPAIMKINFDEVRDALAKELEKYRVVVTVDTVKDAKNLATKLNKIAQEIDRRRKEEVKLVSAPIEVFKEQMNQLKEMCLDGRGDILSQVNKFEDETRAKLQVLLEDARDVLWAEHGVTDDFKSAEFDDLLLLGNITGKGNLTKGARDTLEARVKEDRARQDKVKLRLYQLEAESYKAGLTVPLTEQHVKAFLRVDSDDLYDSNLRDVIASEVERQAATEEKMREKLEQEQRAAQEAAQAAAAEVAADDDDNLPATDAPAPTKHDVPEGKVAWVVTARFEVATPPHVSAADVETKLRAMIEAAGFTSLVSLEARRGDA